MEYITHRRPHSSGAKDIFGLPLMVEEQIPVVDGAVSTSVVDGIIYAIGGCTVNQYGSALSTVEAYDPATMLN